MQPDKHELPWENKAQAMKSLFHDFALKVRDDGTWYVSGGVWVRNGGITTHPATSAENPVMAILGFWKCITDLNPDEYLEAGTSTVRRVRWNGFMWADVATP